MPNVWKHTSKQPRIFVQEPGASSQVSGHCGENKLKVCGLKEPAGVVFINPARCICVYVCMYVGCTDPPPLPPGYRRPGLAAKSFLFPWKKKGQNKLLNLENTVLVFLFLFFEITETFGPNDCSVKRCGTSSWKYREKTIDTREVETVCTKLMSNLWMELWCLPGNLLLFET